MVPDWLSFPAASCDTMHEGSGEVSTMVHQIQKEEVHYASTLVTVWPEVGVTADYHRMGCGWWWLRAMSDVKLDDVSRVNPDGTSAVSHLSLYVRDAELMVILGPSGSRGSSTAGPATPSWPPSWATRP